MEEDCGLSFVQKQFHNLVWQQIPLITSYLFSFCIPKNCCLERTGYFKSSIIGVKSQIQSNLKLFPPYLTSNLQKLHPIFRANKQKTSKLRDRFNFIKFQIPINLFNPFFFNRFITIFLFHPFKFK